MLTIVFAAVSAILIAECAVRITSASPSMERSIPRDEKTAFQASNNPILGYEFVPSYFDLRPDNVESFGFINQWGFRDWPRELNKPTGTVRLLLFGSAVAAGSTLIQDIPQTIPALIEASLRRRFPAKKVEVLNFGIPWYTFRSEIELLRTRGLIFNPDLSVFLFLPSQTLQDTNALRGRYKYPRPAFIDWLFSVSALFRTLAVRSNWLHFQSEIKTKYFADRQQASLGSNSIIAAFKELSELQSKTAVIVLLWPDLSGGQIGYPDWMVDQKIENVLIPEKLCLESKIRCVRMAGYVKAAINHAWQRNRSVDFEHFVQQIAPDGILVTEEGANIFHSAIINALLENQALGMLE